MTFTFNFSSFHFTFSSYFFIFLGLGKIPRFLLLQIQPVVQKLSFLLIFLHIPGTWKKSELSYLWTWNMFLLRGLGREFQNPRAYMGWFFWIRTQKFIFVNLGSWNLKICENEDLIFHSKLIFTQTIFPLGELIWVCIFLDIFLALLKDFQRNYACKLVMNNMPHSIGRHVCVP